VGLDDRACDRQAKAGPSPKRDGSARKNRSKTRSSLPLGQPGSGVAHLELDSPVAFRDRDADGGLP